MKQYYDKNNDKWTVKRLDSKSNIKRKYKLIIEEEYICESDSTNRILKEDESLYDMTKFYTSKWGNENARLVVGGVLCYLCIACVCAWFKLVPVLVIASIAIIIFYIRVNVVMMNYVDKKVHEKK